MSLRPYQERALEMIQNEFKSGKKKVLLHMSTGAGKTVCFSEILKSVSSKGKHAIMVVRGKMLVENASSRLRREGVIHGVQQANHWMKNLSSNIQICSIDTLVRRGARPKADLIVIDEAHLAVGGKFKEFIQSYQDAFVLAVTATPYCRDSLEHLADTVVHPITVQELIDLGFLMPPRYFAPIAPDLTGLRTLAGDFENQELENRMSRMAGDIVGHWQRLGEGRPTVCFAVNIHHSLSIVESFVKAGIKAEHIEADTPDEDRVAAIARLISGETKILSNVGILCTGVDIPPLSCIMMARPTKSYSLYIQQAGRGTRPHPESGKKDFIMLDYAGNILRHGLITDEPEVFLEGMPKGTRATPVMQCPQCYAFIIGGSCPECDFVPEKKRATPEEGDGVLSELQQLPLEAEISLFVKRLKETAKRKNYKRGWAYYKCLEKYGEFETQKHFPKRNVPSWISRKS
jgi:DNA repair protein RadD